MSEKIISKLKKKVVILEEMLEVKTRDLFIAKEEVEKTSAFIKSVIDSMNEIILSIDETGKVELANSAAKIKLKAQGEFKNKSIRSILGDNLVDQLVESKNDNEQIEALIQGKNHKFPALVSRKGFKNLETNKSAYIYSIIDISKLKAKEKIIEKQRAQLVQNTQLASLGEMASGIAHEINNPVTIIEGQLRRLRDYISDDDITIDERVKLTEKIQANLCRVVNIVAGIRKISRKGEDDNIEAIKIASIFKSLKNLCNEKFKNENIKISFKLFDENLSILTKETQLLQVLMNLITNSCDAISQKAKRWISLQVEVEDNFCKLRVTDSGEGIDNDLLEKIFNPFFTTKDIGKGTGIGLSISKQMIDDQGGTLDYELFNNNTSFVISLKRG